MRAADITAFTTLTALLVATSLTGCGYLAWLPTHEEYDYIGVGERKGSLTRSPKYPTPCNAEFIRKYWGEPDVRAGLEGDRELWTYKKGWRWVGGGPWLIIPMPIFIVPIGTYRTHFEVRNDGTILALTHDTAKGDVVTFPYVQRGMIDYVSPYELKGEDCIFRKPRADAR
jgi:hypothetical protein